ncbi:hypothetical protein ACCP96_15415 [Xanthomonas campestris pv. fici]|uniref:hypothetical protein n=1 Tax=Xanthomonas euvesicatoria TaxID=456327 RepID=UPI0035570902
MIRQLKPWAYGPFELLLNAELHYRVGEDFDRRIAMVGFDNAIEVAITTYLGLHPMQRGNREYEREEIQKWLRSYHSKVDFFFKTVPLANCLLIASMTKSFGFITFAMTSITGAEPACRSNVSLMVCAQRRWRCSLSYLMQLMSPNFWMDMSQVGQGNSQCRDPRGTTGL